MKTAALLLFASAAFGDTWIAHRVDDQRVVFFFGEVSGPADPPPETMKAQAQYAGDFAQLTPAQMRTMKIEQLQTGANAPMRLDLRLHEQLSLRIAGADTAKVEIEEFVHEVSCSDHFIGAVARVTDGVAAFSASKLKYYIVGTWKDAPKVWGSAGIRKAEIEKAKLEPILNQQLRAELRKIESKTAEWKRMDKALADGQGVLTYDVQSVPMGNDVFYFVRAQWTVGARPAFLLAVWLNAAHEIRGVDAFYARAMRSPDFASYKLDLAWLPKILNTVDFEGSPAVLITAQGLESFSIELQKLTPEGFTQTGVMWGYGC